MKDMYNFAKRFELAKDKLNWSKRALIAPLSGFFLWLLIMQILRARSICGLRLFLLIVWLIDGLCFVD